VSQRTHHATAYIATIDLLDLIRRAGVHESADAAELLQESTHKAQRADLLQKMWPGPHPKSILRHCRSAVRTFERTHRATRSALPRPLFSYFFRQLPRLFPSFLHHPNFQKVTLLDVLLVVVDSFVVR
jgi:hypothetical protein